MACPSRCLVSVVFTALVGVSTPASALTGGPDAFGYGWETISPAWVDLPTTVGAVSMNWSGDDTEVNLTLPWSFPYYGSNQTNVRVSDNGAIRFATTGDIAFGNANFPSTGSTAPDIAPWWDDLRADGTREIWYWNDTANSRFIISWDPVVHYSSTSNNLQLQLQLYSNGVIEFHYQDVVSGSASLSYGASATIGIQNRIGNNPAGHSLVISYNNSSFLTAHSAVRVSNGCNVDNDLALSSSVTCGGTDCNDSNAAIHPGATEVCDGLDQDCDGVADDGFDADLDGYTSCGGDCDDHNNTIHPNATEICNGVDDDCLGGADGTVATLNFAPLPTTILDAATVNLTVASPAMYVGWTVTDVNVGFTATHTYDADLDISLQGPVSGFSDLSSGNGGGNPNFTGTTFDDEAATSITVGAAPFTGSFIPETPLAVFDGPLPVGTWTLVVTDDAAPDDGQVTAASLVLTLDGAPDADGDGSTLCEGDCDDADANNYPGNFETCDGLDNDCSGAPLASDIDQDGDGVTLCDGDCNDTSAASYPGAPETCNGLDDDCDGYAGGDEVDWDGDAFLACNDCDDYSALTNPSEGEHCDGYDNNCDGLLDPAELDDDGDGYVECDGWDCDDANIWTYVGAEEVCDLWDNDCDGSLPADELDGDGDGWAACTGDCDDTNIGVAPGNPEICDGLDDDCNGLADADAEGESDADGDTVLSCADCNSADATVYAGAEELCDGVDNDCTGYADDGTLVLQGMGAGQVFGGQDPILPAQITATLDVTGALPISILDVDVLVSLAHTWDSDVDISLTSPMGTMIDLSSGNGGSDDNYDQTIFDDEAGESITAGSAPFSGAWMPEEPLAAFDGQDARGTWTLTVTDTFPTADDGTLLDWWLGFRTDDGLDTDGDGSARCADCDDGEALAVPGGEELCDGIDNDCNPATVEGDDSDGDGFTVCSDDCDDAAATTYPAAPELCDGIDNDCDASTTEDLDADGDGIGYCLGDCDDTDPTVGGSLVELCDGIDNDCNALADADPAGEVDADGDGVLSCEDCADGDAMRAPGMPEVCNGVDDDCDAVTNEQVDQDGDGVSLCSGDCDEGDAALFPGNVEACDGIDNDCDPGTDELADPDGDGVTLCQNDCAPDDAANMPGGTELCDGQDNDCNGASDFDAAMEADVDGDGHLSCDDCDDAAYSVNAAATELCNGVDDDCDGTPDFDAAGEVDGDADGWLGCMECDDVEADAFPGNEEVCDGLDNDCDAGTDEAVDGDVDGVTLCDGDCAPLDEAVFPGAEEVCNDGMDDDCDPATDEAVDGDGDTFTICDRDCDDGDDTIAPGADEVCDGLDNDCDRDVPGDEEDVDSDGVRACDDDCNDNDAGVNPNAPESCDGHDNDCDGTSDDSIEDEDGDGLSPCEGDCDDRFDFVMPGAEELCDLMDDDCDGALGPDELDLDGDLTPACLGDCDDNDPAVGNTLAEATAEACSDGLDNDCDGAVDAEDEVCAQAEELAQALADLQAALDANGDGADGGCGQSSIVHAPPAGRWGVLLGLGVLAFGVRRRRAA